MHTLKQFHAHTYLMVPSLASSRNRQSSRRDRFPVWVTTIENASRRNIRNERKSRGRRRNRCTMYTEMIGSTQDKYNFILNRKVCHGTTATESYSASNLARFGCVTQYFWRLEHFLNRNNGTYVKTSPKLYLVR